MLEIALGYGAQLLPVFAGPVRSHRLLLSNAGAPQLVLEGVSHAAPAPLRDEIALTATYGATLLALEAERALGEARPTETRDASMVLHGQATLDGTTNAQPGALLELRGLGDEFDRSARIVAVHHSLSSGGWTTRVDFHAD